MTLRRLALGGALVLLAGCATTEERVETPPEVPEGPSFTPVTTEGALVKKLGLERPRYALGAIERTFDSCQLDPNKKPCATRYVTLVHYQLLCRESEGTVSETPVELKPIVTEDVIWNANSASGTSRTDENGYGEIIALGDRSLLPAHVNLRLGTRFVGLTLGEMTKVVLPVNFCTPRPPR